MKKIVIIIICLFLLLSAVNFGTSKPIPNNNSTSEADYSIDNAQEQQILQNINRLDGFFTEYRGQVGNDSVRYYIQGKGVWFLDDGVVFEVKEPVKELMSYRDQFDRYHPEFEPEMPSSKKSMALKLNFEGCNKVIPKGIGLLPHRSNFFYGNDSSRWCTNVPNYEEIIYENIYENIDLRYYNSGNGLKYDFLIHPGGDPNKIKIRCEGTQDLFIDIFNNLVLQTPVGNVIDTELFIYQDSINYKNKVEGAFNKIDSMTYGFEIFSDYSKNEDLIIDPLIYSTFIGGSDYDTAVDIAIDPIDNIYISGYTDSSDFPTTGAAYDTTHNGGYDVFVLKLNPTGSALLYSTFIGGSGSDVGCSIQIDSNGNAYMTGQTKSLDFPTIGGAYDTTHNGGYDVFVLKLNPTGSALLYTTFIGGSNDDGDDSIQIDSNGNAYVTGSTGSSNFPNTTGAYDNTHNGGWDAFVLKLNPIGSILLYSTFIGGNGVDWGGAIQIDSSGNAYVTGSTGSSNFPNTTGAYDTTHNDWSDVFVLKLNPTGSALLYSTFIGGKYTDTGQGIQIDSSGNAYVTGSTGSSNFPNTTSAYDITSNGLYDIFVLKLNPTGSALLYSTFIGGNDEDGGGAIQIDSSGNAYVGGYTDSSNFPSTTNAYDTTFNGERDAFVLKLNHTGSGLLYSSFIGGSNYDIGSLVIDPVSNIYVTGRTSSSNFPITTGAYDTTYNGNFDVFVIKLSFNYFPSALDLNISEPTLLRTNSIYLYSNASDNEDLEKNLTPHFEYRDPNEKGWNNTYFSTPQYQNSRWEVSFSPPINATFGLYDFRVRFNDTCPLLSNWFYLNDSVLVLNNIPLIEEITLSNNSAILGDSISILINATDIEDFEKNLTMDLEFRNPSELLWENANLNIPTYVNGRWECSFSMPFDALFGYYDFRVRCNDSDGNYSAWLYLNDSLLVYNTGPKVIDVKLSEILIYRTGSVYLFINGSDLETPEDTLSFYVQYKSLTEDEWANLTGNYLDNTWEVSFATDKDSILGNYDFRVKFEDNESLSSGWVYINDSLEVLNNLPVISEDLDDISIGIQRLFLDLTPFESDIEDTDENLTWSITPQIYSYIESIGIINTENDTLKITPKENVTGTEEIELTLTDKDSGTAVKSDIKISIDSTISEFTPKVTLLSPTDKTTVDTLTPTLKWELDYSGTELITYSVALDENPDSLTTIKTGLTTTEYTLENELVDGKTYYWEVEPTNGVCLSGSFRFTIDLGFEPIYKVNLTTERNSITIKQGESKDINLTVTNEGNSIDNFNIEISSANLQSQISIDKTNVQLDLSIDSKVKLSIDIPDDFATGDYSITVTATSLSDVAAYDEITIDVKVVSKDFKPEYNVSISISPSSLNLKQGDSENITITISNDGNIEDDFTIKFESNDFTSANIQFSKSSLPLPEGDSNQITVTIKIPEDMEPGVYTIKFIVESNDNPIESTLTIIVKDGEEPKDGDEDNTMLYAGIGIVVIIIIVILILLFIFLKKKGKEEEPPVEEAQPPPPVVTPQVVPQFQVEVQPTRPIPKPQVEEQPKPTPQPTIIPKIKDLPNLEDLKIPEE